MSGTVVQQGFHPMRGHVRDGQQVACPSGEVLTIKSSMTGWAVVRRDGSVLGHAGFNAAEVTRLVLACA